MIKCGAPTMRESEGRAGSTTRREVGEARKRGVACNKRVREAARGREDASFARYDVVALCVVAEAGAENRNSPTRNCESCTPQLVSLAPLSGSNATPNLNRTCKFTFSRLRFSAPLGSNPAACWLPTPPGRQTSTNPPNLPMLQRLPLTASLDL
ncbi:hypothetical protein BD410DRAFT_888660 [Rickenella mellea]|uniref:Uncharacterized protein n=1 Tax=Rickenella mellea TaxID=50990 RepID=A0A4Y7PNV9_9AGAM|nr:hypothetical protein BD410DRAFT_888660 [Rickenella mellea]